MNLWLQKYFSPILTKLWVLVAPQKSWVASSITRPVWQKKKSLSWDQTGELTIFNWEKLFCGDIIFPTAHTLLVVFELRCSSPPKSLYISRAVRYLNWLFFYSLFWAKNFFLNIFFYKRDIMQLLIFAHENMKKLQHTLQPQLFFSVLPTRPEPAQIPNSVP